MDFLTGYVHRGSHGGEMWSLAGRDGLRRRIPWCEPATFSRNQPPPLALPLGVMEQLPDRGEDPGGARRALGPIGTQTT